MDQDPVYHIASRDHWSAAQETGSYVVPSLESEGFIHFSAKSQCAGTANLYYAGQRSLLLLTIDTTKLSSKLVWEPSRDGALFPHLYGPLNIAAVAKVEEWRAGADAVFTEPSSANLSAKSDDK